jgi:hypothetical protein
MSIVIFILGCILIIVAIVLTSMAIILQQRRNACLNYPSPWCYTDWQCGGVTTSATGVSLPPLVPYPVSQAEAQTNGYFAYSQMLEGLKQCNPTDYYILADTRVGTWVPTADETKGYILFPDGSTANNIAPSGSRTITTGTTTTTAPDINYTDGKSTGSTNGGRAVYYFTTVAAGPAGGTDVFMVVRDLVENSKYGGTSTGITVTYGPGGQANSAPKTGYIEPLALPSGVSGSTGRNPGFAKTIVQTVNLTPGTGSHNAPVSHDIPGFTQNLPPFKYVPALIPTGPVTITDPTTATTTAPSGIVGAVPTTNTAVPSTCGSGNPCFFSYPAGPGSAYNSGYSQAPDPVSLIPSFTYTRDPTTNYVNSFKAIQTPYDKNHISFDWATDVSQGGPNPDRALALPPLGAPNQGIPDPRWYFNRKGIALYLTAVTDTNNLTVYRPVIETIRYNDNTDQNSCFQVQIGLGNP